MFLRRFENEYEICTFTSGKTNWWPLLHSNVEIYIIHQYMEKSILTPFTRMGTLNLVMLVVSLKGG